MLRRDGRPPIYSVMTRFFPSCRFATSSFSRTASCPLFVGREKSVAALEAAMAADKELFLVAQLDPGEDDPDRDALYDLGVVATAMQLLKLPDGTVRVLVEGVQARAAGQSRRRATAIIVGRGRGGRRGAGRRARGPGADALGDRPVRELRQAQQAAAAPRPAIQLARSRSRRCSPTRSPPTCRSRSPTSRRCSASSTRRAGWKWCSPSWRASSACCRSRRRSAAASSARWRRPSANII